ncbi:elongation factor P-like protein EfpL [Ketobacter alkanivorans]|uniref:Elongation factor P-like protein n=1 Tax=Ketobacter alkanivorans TaxID=1917421 RepID=A0A2K9LQ11_9GAMM|nr:elongation factor P-like protein YeiP [Ketobacter alkanivorans]AUM14231.1 elongation factor P-like protein YeiP [Ketobacter alkanivorans]
MPKACDIKKGAVVSINDQPYIVKHIEVRSPSARGAATLYKMRFNHAQTHQKHDETFTGDDMLKLVDFSRRAVQFLYQEGDSYIFMDKEDYSQHPLDRDIIEEQILYLTDNLEGIQGLIVEEHCVGIELPQHVVLEIVDTAPNMKNASATNRTKPATLSTGLEVQVPEYIESGEHIKVSTVTGKYVSRA